MPQARPAAEPAAAAQGGQEAAAEGAPSPRTFDAVAARLLRVLTRVLSDGAAAPLPHAVLHIAPTTAAAAPPSPRRLGAEPVLLRVAGLGDRSWPPPHGYTLALWLRPAPRGWAPLTLSLRPWGSAHAKAHGLGLTLVQDGTRVLLRASGGSAAELGESSCVFTLLEGRPALEKAAAAWHHVALNHQRGGAVRVLFDGQQCACTWGAGANRGSGGGGAAAAGAAAVDRGGDGKAAGQEARPEGGMSFHALTYPRPTMHGNGLSCHSARLPASASVRLLPDTCLSVPPAFGALKTRGLPSARLSQCARRGF